MYAGPKKRSTDVDRPLLLRPQVRRRLHRQQPDAAPGVDIDAPIVFVGYGVTAPEFGWDDYAGIDVKGKVILCIVGDPPSNDPAFFGGKALTYYGRWTYKFEQAAREAQSAHSSSTAPTSPATGGT